MKRRNILVALCSILALSCVSLGGIALNNASAEETQKFEMRYGASARTVKGESGLRFQATVDETTANTVVANESRSFGMLIVPTDYITDEILTAKTFVEDLTEVCTSKGTTLTNIETTKAGDEIVPYLDDDGNYYFNGVIDVSYNNTNRDFTAIAYIKKVNDDETVTYEYAEFSKAEDGTGEASYLNNSRSIAEIASAALNDTREEYKLTGVRREVCVDYVKDALTRAAKKEEGATIEGLFALDGETALAPNGATTLGLASKADLRLNWSSSDEVVATVEGGEVSVGAYVGQATITASIGAEFVAVKDVKATAKEGTFKWTENSISTVATGYDALTTEKGSPAKLNATTVDGVNAVEVTRGIVNASSTPTIMFNDADCFFNLNSASVITFKVGLSAGFYSEGYGGVVITYKDAPSPLASGSKTAATVATFNEKLYVSATSDSTDLTLDYAITTVNGTRQVLYKAVASTTLTETAWIDFTLYFPSDDVATIEDLQISFGSYNFQVNNVNAGLCDNTKIYVSDITVDAIKGNTYSWNMNTLSVVAKGVDNYANQNMPSLTVTKYNNENVLQLKYADGLFDLNGTYKHSPTVEFINNNALTLQKGSKVTFKVRTSDEWDVSNNNGGIYIFGSNGTISSEGKLWTAATASAIRSRYVKKASVSAWNIFANGTIGEKGWVTVTIDFTGVENPTLEGLSIMYGAGYGTTTGGEYHGLLSTQAQQNCWIYISDLTVVNP